MKVKCFDENTEKDLEGKINAFLSGLTGDIIDIKYEIYCFSAMVIYYEKE